MMMMMTLHLLIFSGCKLEIYLVNRFYELDFYLYKTKDSILYTH